jgi:hypothetical protein
MFSNYSFSFNWTPKSTYFEKNIIFGLQVTTVRVMHHALGEIVATFGI